MKVPFIQFQGKIQDLDTIMFIIKMIETWIDKVKDITSKTNTLRIYFNDHYGVKAVINALEFNEI
jgi:hypothetical protein